MGKQATKTIIKPNLSLAEPPLYKIVYIDDNITTMSFVVDTLINHFDYNEDTAEKITEDIHNEGSAVVAVLPYEIAEQKVHEVIQQARDQEFPLEIRLESEGC